MWLDRRRLVELAAAGTIFAGPARAESDGGTQIVVDLGDVRLPEKIAHTMELQIRRAVLMAVAEALPHTKFKSLPLPKGARGIIIRRA